MILSTIDIVIVTVGDFWTTLFCEVFDFVNREFLEGF